MAHAQASTFATESGPAGFEDKYLWLENLDTVEVLDWVCSHNAITKKAFMDSAEFAFNRTRILEVLNSAVRIPYVRRRGEYLYNFWQEEAHPRGIWRRTTLASYQSAVPDWEPVLDIDALNKAEGKKWVFKGAKCMKPDYRHCLVSLSPHGGDAVEVREFDLSSKSFVKDGFFLPVAKTEIDWIDSNRVYVGTDFGPGSMTKASYPRIVKEWTRGTPLSSAGLVYEGTPDDLAISACRDHTPDFERDFVTVQKDFFHRDMHLRKDGKLVRINVPGDAHADVHRQWLVVQTRSPWLTGGETWPAGALLAIQFDDFMAGRRDFTALFMPDARTALAGHSWTQYHIILDVLDDVKSCPYVLTPPISADGTWTREAMPDAPKFSTISVVGTDPDNSDEYWLNVTGFLEPTTLVRGVLGGEPAKKIKQEPAFFDASKFEVSQHFVTSRDGTRVPYFEIAPRGIKFDGTNRTLEYGYGGFELALLPHYSGSIGRAWLERGGVYVIANIRGGGEYGPAWHNAALRANRPKSYEDFAAVAEDLIRRGVTSPQHLGAEGGSNGALLVGNMLTHYPQLYGAVVCEAPLLDMRRYTHLAAGASWIAEYGDPDDPKEWDFIKAFSPYQNLKPDMNYPAVLFYTTTSDDRVGPHQARKMAAKMEHMRYKNVWFYENTEGGHGPGADHAQVATMQTLACDFLWTKLR